MTLILEIAAGILLGFGILRLPTIYRRRKVKNLYLALDSAEVAQHALRNDLYTAEQRTLLIRLSIASSLKERKQLASQLAHSFAEK